MTDKKPTDRGIRVEAVVTDSMRKEFKRLGGTQWLRTFLAQSIEQNRKS